MDGSCMSFLMSMSFSIMAFAPTPAITPWLQSWPGLAEGLLQSLLGPEHVQPPSSTSMANPA